MITASDAVPFPIARLDEARRLIEANAAWIALFTRASVGTCFDEVIVDRRGQRAYRNSLATTAGDGFTFYATLASGSTEILAYLRFSRQPSGWYVTGERVQRDSTNAELLFERERWRAVVRDAAEGIAVLDEHARFVEVNTSFLDIVEPRTSMGVLLDDQGIVGWRLAEVVAPVLSERYREFLDGSRTRSLPVAMQVGSRRLDVTVTPTVLPGGLFSGACLVVRDRTPEDRIDALSTQLSTGAAFLEELYRVMPGVLVVFGSDGLIQSVNEATSTLLGRRKEEIVNAPISSLLSSNDTIEYSEVAALASENRMFRAEKTMISRTGESIPVLVCATTCSTEMVVCIAIDIRERKRLEMDLQQAQKLESVGRLASGVAHEINTPVQFVNDCIHFVRDAVKDLFGVIEKLEVVQRSVLDGVPATAVATEAAELVDAADLPYLLDRVPKALERAIDGLGRVTTIVRSMKEFAHPDQTDMTTVDLNRAVESTLTIARNEYKYVADLETDFGDLPPVQCHAGDVNQAILNIVVNAAHAISDVVQGTDGRGAIRVRTRRDGDQVVIAIADTGGGIPDAVCGRIFDPFFTTKEVGKGTGQGLAIARSVIVEKHRGALWFETELGKGTTFFIRVPIDGHASRLAKVTA